MLLPTALSANSTNTLTRLMEKLILLLSMETPNPLTKETSHWSAALKESLITLLDYLGKQP